MKRFPHLLRSLVFLLLLLPLLFTAVAIATVCLGILAHGAAALIILVGLTLAVVITAYACFRSGRTLVREGYAPREKAEATGTKPSRDFFVRYPGVVIACGYTVLAALIAVCLPPRGNGGVFETAATVLLWSHLPSSIVASLAMIFSTPKAWPFLIPPFAIYLVYAGGMAWEFRKLGAPRTQWKGRAIFAAAFVLCAAVFLWRTDALRESVVHFPGDVERMDDRIYTESYILSHNNKLVKIPTPLLAIESEHPRLDGATALFPVYAAAAQTIYKNIAPEDIRKRVVVSTTPQAYANLIDGRADVIFCAQPSPAQIAAAKEKGVEFQLTPLGREAFVFFVNAANPVDALTTEQLRAIYTRSITNWSEVGGHKEKILPFQRPADSGSQTAMELQVMRGMAMAAPMKEERIRGMGGIILETAAYRNAANAIGYSFRFFVTTMADAKGIKLLKIDGVAPKVETIRDGTYPYAGNFYAITTNKTAHNPHIQELTAWFLSAQGQKLIEDSGYVALGNTP